MLYLLLKHIIIGVVNHFSLLCNRFRMHRKRFVGFKDEINKEQCYALLLTLYRKVQVTNIHAADVGRVGGAWLKATRQGL